MTIGEFKKWLDKNCVPDSAHLTVAAKYGNHRELSDGKIEVSRDEMAYSHDIIWEDQNGNLLEPYDEEDAAVYPRDGEITAVCVWGW